MTLPSMYIKVLPSYLIKVIAWRLHDVYDDHDEKEKVTVHEVTLRLHTTSLGAFEDI